MFNLPFGNIYFWVFYYLGWGIFYVALIIYVWKLLHKPIANIFRKQGNLLFQVGFKRLDKTQEKFNFKDGTYIVDFKKTAWIDERNRPHLAYLENEALPLTLTNPKGLKVSHDAKKLNEISGKDTVQQLVKGALGMPINTTILIAFIVISFIAGFGIAYAINWFMFPPTTTTTPPPPEVPIP